MNRKQLAQTAKNWKVEFQKALAWSKKENEEEIHSILKRLETDFITVCDRLETYSGEQGELFEREFSDHDDSNNIHAVLDGIIEKVSKLKVPKS